MTVDPDTLTIKVNGAAYTGWTQSRVTRGVERFPSDFDIMGTDPFPSDQPDVIAKPGDPCQILLGSDVVVTGYVDRVYCSLSGEAHNIRITGRGKCQDLADCSAVKQGGQAGGISALTVAQELVQPFTGITASSLSGDGLGNYFSFAINLSETPYEILEQIARYEALLIYEDANGNVVFSQVGTRKHSSGVVQGLNCQSADAVFSMDQRYSVYLGCYMSSGQFSDIGTGANLIATVTDPDVPRYRPRVIVSEQSQNFVSLAELRAKWELARRRGRSQTISVTVDAWRDSAGKLWEPNYLISVDVPACKVVGKTWCIAEVSYERDASGGTTAQLAIMPPDAFSPEPADIQTLQLQVAKSYRDGSSNENLAPTGPS